MSNATELLKRALEHLEWCGEERYGEDLEADIRAYLAAEPEAEPVAWTNQDELNCLGTDATCYMYSEPMASENNIPLYTRPEPEAEPKRKPMTEEEIREAWEARGHLSQAGLISFARAIEKHHKIGDEE